MSTINCTEFERLLDDLVESNGNVDAMLLSKHGEACASCREKWQRYALLERGVADWRTAVPRVDLVDSVVARYAFEQSAPAATEPTFQEPLPLVATATAKSPRRQAWGSVAVAALALGIATLLVLRARAPLSDFADRDARLVVAERTAGSPADDDSDEEFESLVANAGSAYLVLASDAADAVAGASRIIAPTHRLAVLGTDGTEAGVQAEGAWGDEFKPIGREFSEALNFLFDAVPVESPSSI
jgi:hypothetical protein